MCVQTENLQDLCRVDINIDCQPAAASDIYNTQRRQAGLDGQGFGLAHSSSQASYVTSPGMSQGFSLSQNSCQTTFNVEAESSEDMDTADTVSSSNAVPWGIQPFAGIGKRPLVSPASSPVKRKPKVVVQQISTAYVRIMHVPCSNVVQPSMVDHCKLS